MEPVLRENFERFYESKKDELGELSLKESLYLFYLQGHLDPTPVGQDISSEEVAAEIEKNCFLDFIQSCIEDPENMNKDESSNASDYVEVVYPCTKEIKEKCVAWPDRCEEVGGDGKTCGKTIINLSKLCGANEGKSIFVKDKDRLTVAEAKMLATAINDYVSQFVTGE